MQRFSEIEIEDPASDNDSLNQSSAARVGGMANSTSHSQLNLHDYARVGSQQYLTLDDDSILKVSTDFDSNTQYDSFHAQPSSSRNAFFRLNKSLKDDDKRYAWGSRMCLAISIVSAVLVVGLEGFMYGVINVHKEQFHSHARYLEMSIFLALFIFAGVYQVVVTIIAQHTKNMLLFTLLCLFYATMVIYTGIQYKEVSENLELVSSPAWRAAAKGTNIAVIAVLGFTLVAQIVVIYCVLLQSMQWFKFKKIGASIAIKRMYTVFQIHRSLLIFDLFFFLGFTVQFIVVMVADKKSLEFILTCCMLPLTLLVLFLADFAATRELLWLSLFTLSCLVAGVVYVLFKTIRLFTKYTSAYDVALEPGSYFPGRTSMVTFAVITLVFLFVTIACEAWSVWNYNRGLLSAVNTYYSRLPLSGTRSGKSEKDDQKSILID
ncbi:hypothetical protein FDK38_003572 [Candidozyma auris]|nr:hypothetical protein FDK38_003572 [[Candida] auris]